MRSLSEIDTISKRASKAKGFSWGVAEEIGKCIKQLELFGLPGIKNLNQYLKIYDQNKFQKIKLISKSNISENKFHCPISCLLYTSPSPRDISGSRMPSSA